MKKTRIVLMRLHQWLIPAVISLVVFTTTSSLMAQDPYQTVGNSLLDGGGVPLPQQGYAGGMEPFNGPPPGDISIPPYSQISTAPVDQASFQEGMNPWPKVSPFENIWSQHRIDNGLWVNETSNLGRKYHADFSAMLLKIRPPERTRIGDADLDAFLYITPNPNVFPIKDTRDVYQDKYKGGMIGHWGFDQDDGQGIEIGAFYIPYNNVIKHLGTRNGDPRDPADIDILTPVIPVVTDGGWLFSTLEDQRNLRFDTTQDYSYSHHAWGVNTNWYISPVYDRGNIRVRPLLGIRYLGINERFKFEGADSGDLYSIIFTSSASSTSSTDSTTGDTTETAGTAAFAQIGEILFDGPETFATLSSKTETHLLGPEIGFDYVLGGKTFQINGSTSFGLLANREKLKVSGKGFGGDLSVRYFDDSDDTDTEGEEGEIGGDIYLDFDYDPDRVFKSSRTHTHVSPMLAQDINVEVAVLDLIPFIRKSSYFDNAVLRVGYSFILATEVARPETIIEWNDQDIDPKVTSGRTKWWASSYNFGIEWRY